MAGAMQQHTTWTFKGTHSLKLTSYCDSRFCLEMSEIWRQSSTKRTAANFRICLAAGLRRTGHCSMAPWQRRTGYSTESTEGQDWNKATWHDARHMEKKIHEYMYIHVAYTYIYIYILLYVSLYIYNSTSTHIYIHMFWNVTYGINCVMTEWDWLTWWPCTESLRVMRTEGCGRMCLELRPMKITKVETSSFR
jgi:hypothetical protein